jgi:hypothetical protein
MKTKPSTPSPRPAKKLPKARVGYSNPFQLQYINDRECEAAGLIYGEPTSDPHEFPVTVIPHATPAEARAFARFWGMTDEERVKMLSVCYKVPNPRGDYKYESLSEGLARAVLALLAGERGRK